MQLKGHFFVLDEHEGGFELSFELEPMVEYEHSLASKLCRSM